MNCLMFVFCFPRVSFLIFSRLNGPNSLKVEKDKNRTDEPVKQEYFVICTIALKTGYLFNPKKIANAMTLVTRKEQVFVCTYMNWKWDKKMFKRHLLGMHRKMHRKKPERHWWLLPKFIGDKLMKCKQQFLALKAFLGHRKMSSDKKNLAKLRKKNVGYT